MCLEMQIPVTKNYTFSSTFINTDDIRFWSTAGLPTDSVSLDNYVIISNATYLPFIIDPQSIFYKILITVYTKIFFFAFNLNCKIDNIYFVLDQGKDFIKFKETETNLKVLKATDDNLIDKFEEAVLNNNSVLIEILEKPDNIICKLCSKSNQKLSIRFRLILLAILQ